MKFLPETTCFGLKRLLWRWAGAKIGRDVRICSSAFILGAGELSIGDGTWIGHQVYVETGSRVDIGANVDLAPRVYIGTGSHEIDAVGPRSAGKGTSLPVAIGDGAWIGANAVILPGVTIGEKTVIGAGAVVTKSIPARAVAVGCPAKAVRPLAP